MKIEGKTRDGSQLLFLVSEPLELAPKDGKRLPPYIVISHLAANASEQYYTVFTVDGLKDLVDELQHKLKIMERFDSNV